MATVTGDKKLDRKLSRLRKSVQTKVSKAAVRGGLSVGAKEVKKQIPSQYKAARKAIGWSFKKDRKTGVLAGKVGVAVGKKRAKLREWGRKETAKRQAAGKKGEGVNPNTLQIFVVGTKNMAAKFPGVATKGMRTAKSAIKTAMAGKFRQGIMREAMKG